MISKAAMLDELHKIAGEYHGFQLASGVQQPTLGARSSRRGAGVSGSGYDPTRGGFLLASGIQGEKVAKPDDYDTRLHDNPEEDMAGKDKEKDSDLAYGYFPYKSSDFKPAKLASPTSILARSRSVATKPNTLGSSGPSIAQIAKPFGFGRAGAVPGTDKAGRI